MESLNLPKELNILGNIYRPMKHLASGNTRLIHLYQSDNNKIVVKIPITVSKSENNQAFRKEVMTLTKFTSC